jgi:hypothetical protein
MDFFALEVSICLKVLNSKNNNNQISKMSYKCDTKEYTELLVSDLLFDEKVADMVEKNGYTFPPKLFNCLYDQNTFHLDQKRLDSVMAGWEIGLPPVSVKENMGKYQVLNGRHRVAAAIMKGVDSIPVTETN